MSGRGAPPVPSAKRGVPGGAVSKSVWSPATTDVPSAKRGVPGRAAP